MKILFVCLGNICRSPAAEGVMQHLLREAGLADRVTVDSAGTIGLHEGHGSDHRMKQAAARRGITLTHLARQVRREDLRNFDLIVPMDRSNLEELRKLDSTDESGDKMRLFCSYCTEHEQKEVPDPYYGGPEGFELVLDLMEDGCTNLIRKIQARELAATQPMVL